MLSDVFPGILRCLAIGAGESILCPRSAAVDQSAGKGPSFLAKSWNSKPELL